jgi:4-amino-4-deoxy-L-arabinose transferase-like glycosyltransferase
MGQSILDGQLPYINLWDLKPPLAFFSYALFILLLGKSIVAIRIAGAISIAVTAFLIYIVGNKMWSKSCGIIAATLTVIFASLAPAGQCTMTEIVSLVPLIASMTILVTQRMTSPYLFIAGLLLGISAFIRLNLAFVGVFVTFALFFIILRNKDRSHFNQLIAFVLGGVLIVLMVVSPYLYTGNLQTFLDSVFLAPLSFSTSQFSTVSSARRLIQGTFGYSNIILWLGFIVGLIWAVKDKLHSSSVNSKNLIIYSTFFLLHPFQL